MEKSVGIAFTELTSSVNSFFNKKVILNDLSGSFEFGSINGLMGISGSGKTSLLNCLYGSNKYIVDKRTRLYRNSQRDLHSCYIPQDQNERLFKGLTVKQTLIFASKLKNSDENGLNHKLIAEKLLKEFLIDGIKDNYIENCSGGEIKRIIIALELTAYQKPNILLIDEPTTGLDSSAAEMVIDCLRSLSRNHSTLVLTSIHQPNNCLFLKFDSIYVLARGGIALYWGKPQKLKSTLINCNIECNEFQVPIEVLLEVSSEGMSDKRVFSLYENNYSKYPKLKEKCEKEMTLSPNGIKQKSKTFRFKDFANLFIRGMTYTYFSNFYSFLVQIIFFVIVSLFFSLSYNRNIGQMDGCFSLSTVLEMSCLEMAHQKAILDENIYFIFSSSLVILMIQISISTSVFLKEMKIFSSEHRNKWYSTGSYYLSKSLVEMISTLIFSFIYCYLTFTISRQLDEGFRFYKYLFVITFAMFCTQALGSSIGIILYKNQRLALFISIGILSTLTSFNNFLVPVAEFDSAKQVISDMAFPKFLFNSILIAIYGFSRCEYPEKSYVLYQYSINDDQIFWDNSKNLVYNYLIFKIFEFIVLWIKANKFSINLFFNLFNNNISDLKLNLDVYTNNNGFVEIDLKQLPINLIQNGLTTKRSHEIMIAWIDLSFTIKKRFSRKRIKILDNLSGGIKIGSLNALMGPSGAGKTTLLNCLINKRYASGLDPNTKIMKNTKILIKTCFITQNNGQHLLNGLTVRQTLLYASKLKNISRMRGTDHRTNVINLMRELMIEDISHNRVENCSGGQQKRIVIASELTACVQPNLLCIDEPTSGLDSASAKLVIDCLKSLSRKYGISVIASIHQPNTQLFLKFDNIYLLTKGGKCVYSGSPLNLRQHLIDCKIECTETEFPIEVMLNISSKENPKLIENLVKKTNENKQKLLSKYENQTQVLQNGIESQNKSIKIKDFWILFKRMMAFAYVSQWKSILIQFLITQMAGFATVNTYDANKAKASGCLERQSFDNQSCFISFDKWEEESHISQTIKYNFSILSFPIFLQLVVTTLTFSSDINIFLNERRNGWYSSGAYYWAKSTIDIIPVIITFLVYSWFVNIYDSWDTYLGYLYLITLAVLCVQCLGHISGIIFNDNQSLSMLFSFTLLLSQLIVSNSLIPIKEFHYIIQYLSELSFLKHCWQSIVIMNYGFNRCQKDSLSLVLYRFGVENKDFWYNSSYLILHLIVLKTFTLITLIIKTHVFRSKRKIDIKSQKKCKTLCLDIYSDSDIKCELTNFKELGFDGFDQK